MPPLDAALADLEDPRVFATGDPAGGAAAHLHALASGGVEAATTRVEEASRDAVQQALLALLRAGDGAALSAALRSAPSLAVARYLWRSLELAERAHAASAGTLATTLFAIPVVVVAGLAQEGERARLRGVVAQREALATLLREHRALGGCETFVLSGSLAAADAIELTRLPALLAASRIGEAADALPLPPLDLPAADLDLAGPGERVFLRFAVGAAVAAAGLD
ncbi:MAG: hypothetical protein ACM3QY_02370, partial [Candidatus Levyibacteriota bacterium]